MPPKESISIKMLFPLLLLLSFAQDVTAITCVEQLFIFEGGSEVDLSCECGAGECVVGRTIAFTQTGGCDTAPSKDGGQVFFDSDGILKPEKTSEVNPWGAELFSSSSFTNEEMNLAFSPARLGIVDGKALHICVLRLGTDYLEVEQPFASSTAPSTEVSFQQIKFPSSSGFPAPTVVLSGTQINDRSIMLNITCDFTGFSPGISSGGVVPLLLPNDEDTAIALDTCSNERCSTMVSVSEPNKRFECRVKFNAEVAQNLYPSLSKLSNENYFSLSSPSKSPTIEYKMPGTDVEVAGTTLQCSLLDNLDNNLKTFLADKVKCVDFDGSKEAANEMGQQCSFREQVLTTSDVKDDEHTRGCTIDFSQVAWSDQGPETQTLYKIIVTADGKPRETSKASGFPGWMIAVIVVGVILLIIIPVIIIIIIRRKSSANGHRKPLSVDKSKETKDDPEDRIEYAELNLDENPGSRKPVVQEEGDDVLYQYARPASAAKTSAPKRPRALPRGAEIRQTPDRSGKSTNV